MGEAIFQISLLHLYEGNPVMEPARKIIHIDMDAFYASVEQRDNPELRGKPVAVGGSRQRGVVAAASYEARKFGVRSAMPSVTAARKCPGLIFIKPRFDAYRQVSEQIQSIFHEYTDLVEPLSLDEAFLDVTFHKKGKPSATLIAREIKQRIKDEVNLTASAGVSCNKFLAKIASDYRKPDGIFVIPPEEAETFVEKLEIDKFFGVGKVTAARFHEMGIHFGRDLKKLERTELIRSFGKAGSYYYDIARGIDNRPVNPNRERKSIGGERTFSQDLYDAQELKHELEIIAEIVWNRVKKKQAMGKTITLKVKYADFEQITRSHTFSGNVIGMEQLYRTGVDLLPYDEAAQKGVRLLGLTMSNLTLPGEGTPVQLTLEF
jgi:DNA polymerase IV